MDNANQTLIKKTTSHRSNMATQNIMDLFSGYIRNIQPQGLAQDIASSAGGKIAHAGFLALCHSSSILTKPLYFSMKFGFSCLGKKLVCAFNSPQTITEDTIDQLDIKITEEGFVLVDMPEESGFSTMMYDISNECKNYVITVKPIDIMHMAGGTMGAGVASLTFALFVGTPGLVGMPVLLLSEVLAKGFGEYLAEKGTKKILGTRSDLPIINQAFKHIPQSILSSETQTEEDIAGKNLAKKCLKKLKEERTLEKLISEFELFNVSEEKTGEVEILPKKINSYLPSHQRNLTAALDLTQFIQDDYLPNRNLSPNTL